MVKVEKHKDGYSIEVRCASLFFDNYIIGDTMLLFKMGYRIVAAVRFGHPEFATIIKKLNELDS